MMIIRNDLPQFRRNDIEKLNMNDCNRRVEPMAVEITIKSKKCVFVSIYKQPKVKLYYITVIIDDIMAVLAQCDYNIVLIGDFNINVVRQNYFTDCLELNGLTYIVKEATCFKGEPSVINLIITNKPKRFQNTISLYTGLSDFYNMVCTSTKFQMLKLKPATFKYRTLKRFVETEFKKDLIQIPYHLTEIFDDINSNWLWRKLTRTVKGHRVPYMKRKCDRVKTSNNWMKYKKQRNLLTKLRKKALIIIFRVNVIHQTVEKTKNFGTY